MHIKGLLEMMFDVLSGWIDEFISDMEVRLPLHCALLPPLCHASQLIFVGPCSCARLERCPAAHAGRGGGHRHRLHDAAEHAADHAAARVILHPLHAAACACIPAPALEWGAPLLSQHWAGHLAQPFSKGAKVLQDASC